ncbi:fluoride efflux transporter CrcB [Massilia sp. BSC265]|uniref:fluoride efflux transporter CrcB n=1 Tax=Massilia sp. BSC265 TaxID=1549812 RepID=UPI0004E938C3|nr:fluoride efflux transporter CrcB [Massilia sp. BSC265]KFI08446.1 camphor resistance protein CrcB [Massilia sp. BSC265]KFI08973.1 camphor resistance protein CrcB [Massilia sp. BSC265]
MSWLAVGAGAAIGAWLRWGFGLWLGSLHAYVQIGTLAANLAGGYLVGLALGFFGGHPDLAPEWRLFAVTGFLGGLTTFSSFSGESVLLLQRGEYGWALVHTFLHLLGSILFCAAGFATWRILRS